MPLPSAWPAVQGLAVGVVLLLGFALPPLLQLKNVPAVRVIRRESGALRGRTIGAYVAGLGALAACPNGKEPSMSSKRVLSVGQCGADHGTISRTLRHQFGVVVVPVDSPEAAMAKLEKESFDLVLVNRLLDVDGSSGLDVIRQIKSGESSRAVPVMLVSNYEDAQRDALDAGAEPGFGKATLGHPETLLRLQPYLR